MFYENQSHLFHPHFHRLRAMRRERGPSGYGGPGGFGFGPRGGGRGFMGGGGVPGGRKLSSADLQLVVLALLERQAAHGYELIRILEEISNGFYTPSPGVIYPALTYLEEIGHTTVEPDGARKLYRITDVGRAHLDANRTTAQSMLDALSRIGERMEQVREAFAGLDALDPRAADDLHRARHALKHALFSTRDCTPDEARRITTILDRATADILSRPQPDIKGGK
jgi:DNA-binding PadR family transcriptional regulator